MGLVVFENFAVHFWNFDSRRELPLVAVLMLSWLLLNAAGMHRIFGGVVGGEHELSNLRSLWELLTSYLFSRQVVCIVNATTYETLLKYDMLPLTKSETATERLCCRFSCLRVMQRETSFVGVRRWCWSCISYTALQLS